MKKLYSILICIVVYVNIYATEHYKYKDIDSLKLSLHHLLHDKGEIVNPDSAIKLVVRNRKLLKSEFDDYLYLLKNKIERTNDSPAISEIYYRLGLNHRYHYRYDSAELYYLKALPLVKKIKDYYRLGRIYNEMGVVCRKTDQNTKAIYYFLESIKSSKHSKNYYGKAISENGIGNIYLVQKNYEKALDYFRESIKYGIENRNSFHCELCYGNIGETFLYLQQYDSAKYYINKCLTLAKKRKYPLSQGISYMLLGQVEMNNKHYQEAFGYFEKSLSIQRKVNDKRYLSTILIHYGHSAEKLDLNELAETNLLEGRNISEEIHFIENLIFVNKALYELYYKTKHYKQASDALFLHKKFTDSLYNDEKLRAINDLEFQYQTKTKNQQIELLNTRNKFIENSKKMQRNQLGIIILLFGGLAAFFYFRYQTKKRVTLELKNINEMKSRFFGNISHEFRTPLTLIKGPVERQLKLVRNKSQIADLQIILQNSKRLLSLVDQLLNISKIDAGHFTITAHKGNLSTLLKGIGNSFQFQAKEKSVTYEWNICESGMVWFDHNIIEIIVTNILSNALKFVHVNGMVEFSAVQSEDSIKIKISNSGCTLRQEELQHIFDRFYRVGNGEVQGTGIGLALVKELCLLYRADIDVNISEEKQICFEFTLPVNKAHFRANELVDTKWEFQPIQKPLKTKENLDLDMQQEMDDLSVLLIVEDNKDMRKYIRSCFQSKYKIFEAEDGQKGVTIALNEIPDVIISDVMMPNMSGVELCNQLKSDIKTKHIPVVLLTAKVGDDNALHGLRSGADDYITKPFNAENLVTKVERLIVTRKAIQAKYQKEIVIKPLELVFDSEEEKFARVLQKVLNEYLTNSDFSVDKFCEVTAMSRTQLHRKLKAITGLSATAFIRSQRIKLASEILLKQNASVSEVCFSTGFNDTSYFSKCFKEIQGCTPTEYLKNHSN